MPTIWTYDHTEYKHTLYHGKDCVKNVCKSLREHTKNIIDFEFKIKITSRCNSMLHLSKENL